MKIYVVTSGSYSDYHIVALYSTEEQAQKALELGDEETRIEEYELDSFQIPEHPPGHKPWLVRIEYNTSKIVLTFQEYFLERSEWSPMETFHDLEGFGPEFWVRCWARDDEHAEKIALDKYYQYKAEQLLIGES
jgi:hypothetical protein